MGNDGDTNSSEESSESNNASGEESSDSNAESQSADSDDVAEFVSDSGSDSNGDGNSDSSDVESGAANSNSMDSSDEEEDDCVGISGDDCNSQYDGEGNQLCAQNIQTEECYEVVQSRGVYGRGGFDSGYNAATETAAAEKENLNVIIGVLGGIIAVLVIVVAAGAYFVYSKHTNNKGQTHFGHDSLDVDSNTDNAAGRMDDQSPMITH